MTVNSREIDIMSSPLDWKFLEVTRHMQVVDADNKMWCNMGGLFELARLNRDGNEQLVRLNKQLSERLLASEGPDAMVDARFFGSRAIEAFRTNASALFLRNDLWARWMQGCGLSEERSVEISTRVALLARAAKPPSFAPYHAVPTAPPMAASIPEDRPDRSAEDEDVESGKDFDEVALRILESLIVSGTIPRRYGQQNGYDYVASAYAMAKDVWAFRSGQRAP